MRYYKKRSNSRESICIDKIEKGIESLKTGKRSGEKVGKDLEFFFNRLKESNVSMHDELYVKYCTARMELEKH